jgi:site-specific DNA recombinase
MSPIARRRKATRAIAPADRCVIYLRVSTDEQRQSGLGIEAQRQRVHQYAAARDLAVVGEYSDQGVSGVLPVADRPGMQRALGALEPGVVLLALCIDRLSRAGAAGLYDITCAVEERGASWATVHGAYDTGTSSGRIVVNVLAEIALFEAEQAAERTSRALQAKQARGEYVGGTPFGYTYTPNPERTSDGRRQPGTWSLDPEAIATVRLARALRRQGMNYRDIADELKAAGRPTPGGRDEWHPNSVRRIVQQRDIERRADDLTIDVDVPDDLREAVTPVPSPTRHLCAHCNGIMFGARQKRHCSARCSEAAKYLRRKAGRLSSQCVPRACTL